MQEVFTPAMTTPEKNATREQPPGRASTSRGLEARTVHQADGAVRAFGASRLAPSTLRDLSCATLGSREDPKLNYPDSSIPRNLLPACVTPSVTAETVSKRTCPLKYHIVGRGLVCGLAASRPSKSCWGQVPRPDRHPWLLFGRPIERSRLAHPPRDFDRCRLSTTRTGAVMSARRLVQPCPRPAAARLRRLPDAWTEGEKVH
jgi:hypothetical protein